MKKIIFSLMFLLPSFLMAQNQKQEFSLALNTAELTNINLLRTGIAIEPIMPLPASASITITITDGTVTLADVRDTLCTFWGYSGAPNDNAAKLAFLKQHLINVISSDFGQAKAQAASQAASVLSSQITAN